MAIGKCFSTRRLITLAKWPMVRLGDVCQLTMGQSPKSETYNGDSIGLPFFQGNTDFGKECPTARVWCKAPKKVALTGDILLSVRAPIGAVNTASCKCCIGRGIAALRPKSGALDVVYLKNLLRARRDALEALGTGSTFKAVTKKQLEDFLIPLPTVTCQNLLAKRFELIARLIEMRSHQLDMFGEIAKSRFIEMFGNDPAIERAQLKEICSLITDGTHQPPKFQAKGIPFLFVGNVAGNELTYETSKYISQEDYEALIARTPIGIGDVLVSAVGSFGHPAIVKDKRPFCFQRHIAYFKPMRERVDSIFLHAALLTDESQRYMDKAAKGAAQRTITLKSFKELEIPLPSLALQREFAAFAESVDKSQVAIKREIEKLETLKKALMQEYFG